MMNNTSYSWITCCSLSTDCCPSTWWLDPGLQGWLLIFVVAAPGSPGQAQHSSVPAGTTLSPLSFVSFCPFPPCFLIGARPGKPELAPFAALLLPPFPSFSFLPLPCPSCWSTYCCCSLGFTRTQDPTSSDPATMSGPAAGRLPWWACSCGCLCLLCPQPVSLFAPLAYSPSGPLLPSPPLMPPANFTLSAPPPLFGRLPPTLTQQSFNLSPLACSPSVPIFPSPPPMSPTSFTFSPLAFNSAALVRPSTPSLPQNSLSLSPTALRRPGPASTSGRVQPAGSSYRGSCACPAVIFDGPICPI